MSSNTYQPAIMPFALNLSNGMTLLGFDGSTIRQFDRLTAHRSPLSPNGVSSTVSFALNWSKGMTPLRRIILRIAGATEDGYKVDHPLRYHILV
ncbi:MAG: hypothetical protein VKI82_03385 [Leptolyngbya sp.]|nr:hypothetical protein [Leptolyngbya sp.]